MNKKTELGSSQSGNWIKLDNLRLNFFIEIASFFQETNTIAAVMFFFFAVSVSWVLVNVLLTIIIDGYENVKKELEGRKNELEVIQYIKVRQVLKRERSL